MTNNRIVHHVTREYMKKNKKRTITTIFGIVFMVVLMTCVFVGKDTATNYLEELASLEWGRWHFNVYDITDQELSELTKLEDIEQIGISSDLDYAYLLQSANVDRPYLQIKSYNSQAFRLHNIKLVAGRLPENEKEIILNIEAVNDGAVIKIGDTIYCEMMKRYIVKDESQVGNTIFPHYNFTINAGEKKEAPLGFPFFRETPDFSEITESTGYKDTYTVVGFIEKPKYERREAGGYTAIIYNDGVNVPNGVKNVSIRFDLKRNGMYDSAIEEIVGADNEYEINNMLLIFSENSDDATVNAIVNVMTVFFVALIITASVVLIYNVFNISFDERTKYLGMLSSVGATKKQKSSSVYYEAFILLLIGLPVGFLVGLCVVKLGMKVIKPYLDTLLGMYSAARIDKVPLEISLVGVVLTMAFSVITVWISAYIPARKIGKIGPIECIRGNATRGTRECATNRLSIKMFGACGMLASNSVSREKKKTRGLIWAAAIFMIIFVVTTYASKAVTSMVEIAMVDKGVVNFEIESDFVITAGIHTQYDEEYEKLKARIAADDSVEEYVEYMDGMFFGYTDTSVLSDEYIDAYKAVMKDYNVPEKEWDDYLGLMRSNINFIAFDDKVMADIIKSTGADSSIMEEKDTNPVIVVQPGELSTDSYRFSEENIDFKFYEIDRMTDLEKGAGFDVNFFNYTEAVDIKETVTIAGFACNETVEDYVTFHNQDLWVITDFDVLQKLIDAAMYNKNTKNFNDGEKFGYKKTILVKFKDKSSALYSELNGMYYDMIGSNDNYGITVISAASLDVETISGAMNSVIKILLGCFVALTSVICMLNLYNSTKGRITCRRKELAILRSMGMTESQMRKMLLIEAGEVLLRSVIIAVLVSSPILIIITKTLSNLYGNISFGIPVTEYLIAITITFASLMFITLDIHRAEKSENILEDIRRESI